MFDGVDAFPRPRTVGAFAGGGNADADRVLGLVAQGKQVAGVGVEHDSRSYVFVFHQCLDAVAGGFLVGGKQHPETDGFVHGISQCGQVNGYR